MLVSVQTNALAAGICMKCKDTCLMAGDKSTGCISEQFCRHAVQRRELMGVAHGSQAMTIWTHTCRTAAIVRLNEVHHALELSLTGKFGLSSCAVSHGTSVCKLFRLFFTVSCWAQKIVILHRNTLHIKASQLLHQQSRCQYMQSPIQVLYMPYFIKSIRILLDVATQ